MLKNNGFNVFFEPVDEWKHISQFYNDKKRWAFTFQVEVLNSFTSCPNTEITICERSPWEAYHIFSKTFVSSRYMSDAEFELLTNVSASLSWKPDLFVYLRTHPLVCMDRIKHRNRPCESSIGIEYLNSLHTLYDSLNTLQDDVCFKIVDANRSYDDVYLDVVNVITSFLQEQVCQP
jgi:deoxyadenosine/deoxycytidine kinase